MRILVLAIVASLSVLPLLGPPTVVRADDASDLLPSESDLKSAVAPLTISKYTLGPGVDGWDKDLTFEVGGAQDGAVLTSVDAAVLPTNEGAAGFLQTKLQQLRDGATQQGLVGQLGAADDKMTQDADEAYFGVFMTPDGASNRGLMAILISRYENQVTAVQTVMGWDGSGAIPQSAQTSVGVVLGLISKQVNDLASSD
jgi:hypothetical protein